MNKAVVRRSEQLYGIILKLYPKRYREEFGEEMQFVFSASLKDAYPQKGKHGIIHLWARTVFDAGTSLVSQHLENLKGNEFMKTEGNNLIMQNKVFLWMALATVLLLLVPLIAMQFTSQVNWAPGDFGVMGVLLFGMGSLFVLAARKVNRKYWVGIGFVFAVAFLYVWAELAVGIFTNWGS